MASKDNPSTSVFLLGTLPPPMGGVSVFCSRRRSQLTGANIECVLFDTKSQTSIIRLWFFTILYRMSGKKFVIEINTSNPTAIFFLNFFGLLSYSIFIDHNSSRRFIGNFQGRQLIHIANKCREVRLVNADLYIHYKNIGIHCFDNFSIFSPYIRPSDVEIENAFQNHRTLLDPLVFCERRNIVLSSAWKPVVHSDGHDLYGIEQTINIYSELLPKYPSINFVLLVGELDSSELSDSIKEAAYSLNNQFKNFYFLTGGIPQWPLLRKTIVLLRLTRTDGDSVSIREALDFGCEVIATDISSRPNDVRLTPLDDDYRTTEILMSILNEQKQ